MFIDNLMLLIVQSTMVINQAGQVVGRNVVRLWNRLSGGVSGQYMLGGPVIAGDIPLIPFWPRRILRVRSGYAVGQGDRAGVRAGFKPHSGVIVLGSGLRGLGDGSQQVIWVRFPRRRIGLILCQAKQVI